jgi:hypothetical protein
MGFDKVYTVCINPSVCNGRVLQIPDMKTLTRKHKKRGASYTERSSLFLPSYTDCIIIVLRKKIDNFAKVKVHEIRQ